MEVEGAFLDLVFADHFGSGEPLFLVGHGWNRFFNLSRVVRLVQAVRVTR